MNDFKTIAKAGSDFVNIVFEQASEDIDNTTVDLYIDEMRMKTFVCEGGDLSLTIQPLAEGSYEYEVSQISENEVFVASGSFVIENKTTSSSGDSDVNTILEKYAQILFTKGGNINTNGGASFLIHKGDKITVENDCLVFCNERREYIIPFHAIQYIHYWC